MKNEWSTLATGAYDILSTKMHFTGITIPPCRIYQNKYDNFFFFNRKSEIFYSPHKT